MAVQVLQLILDCVDQAARLDFLIIPILVLGLLSLVFRILLRRYC